MKNKTEVKKLELAISEGILLLEARGIHLHKIQKQTVVQLEGRRRILPPHDEREWFGEYFKECMLQGKNISVAARESYALLRYKQDLAGMSDGSPLGSLFGMTMSGNDNSKEIYQAALREYDLAGEQK